MNTVLAFLNVEYVDEITVPRVHEFIKWRLHNGASPRTVNLDIGALKTMLKRAAEWELIGSNPLEKLKPLRTGRKARRRALTVEEVQKLLADKRDPCWAIWMVLVNTGMRKAELEHLTWDDIDYEHKRVHIRAKDGWQPKNSRDRWVPMPEHLEAVFKALERQRKPRQKYIFTKNGEPLPSLNRSLKRRLKKLGIDSTEISLHSLRYTYITTLIRQRINPKAVQRYAGHSDIRMTLEIYTSVLGEDMHEVMQALSVFGHNMDTNSEP